MKLFKEQKTCKNFNSKDLRKNSLKVYFGKSISVKQPNNFKNHCQKPEAAERCSITRFKSLPKNIHKLSEKQRSVTETIQQALDTVDYYLNYIKHVSEGLFMYLDLQQALQHLLEIVKKSPIADYKSFIIDLKSYKKIDNDKNTYKNVEKMLAPLKKCVLKKNTTNFCFGKKNYFIAVSQDDKKDCVKIKKKFDNLTKFFTVFKVTKKQPVEKKIIRELQHALFELYNEIEKSKIFTHKCSYANACNKLEKFYNKTTFKYNFSLLDPIVVPIYSGIPEFDRIYIGNIRLNRLTKKQ